MNWIVAGLITGVAAYVVDFVMWSKVFNKGMDQYVTPPPAGQKIEMGAMLAKAAVLALAFGLIVAGLLMNAQFWAWLVRANVAGIVVAVLIK